MRDFLTDCVDFVCDFAPLLIAAILVVVIVGGLLGMMVYGSCREAQIYNKLNGTTFTCSDFFWAGDQINNGTLTIKQRQ